MAAPIKPIKRSPQLAPLSREHHEGLLFVWKIRQGLAKNIEPSRIAAFIQWFWQQHLQPHFQKEERALPPMLSQSHPMIERMFNEHGQIKRLVDETTEYGDLKNFETLANLINDHIRFEERQLFGDIEKAASPEQLEWLVAQLKDEEPGEIWNDAFWIKSK